MNVPRTLLAALVVAATSFAPLLTTHASASSVVALDVTGLAARADRVVVGHVEKMESHYLAPGSQRIVTDVTLVTERPVLGDPGASRFVVRHLGGEVGSVGQWVSGEATYHVGERLVLFAAERQGVFYAVGMAQGVLPIREDEGIARVDVTQKKENRTVRSLRTVDDLLDEVASLVAAKKKSR